MVVPLVAAAQAAGAAGSAGATALGLGMGQTDLELTQDLFKKQMRQAKRLWTADWAEASVRHGEACMQSAQQHAEAQATSMATYFQAERIASQGIKLSRDQDSRAYEIAWRSEARESLRDDLANQYNRFNIVMLCDTVCLSCVFSLVAEGSLPTNTSRVMINLFVLCMGVTITLFSISLWSAIIVVRRLHEHTAAILERKLFAQSEDLQKVFRHQLHNKLPTGPNEMYLLNKAYEKWVALYIDPIGGASVQMMAIGVVTMFVTAGLLTQARYLLDYDAPATVPIFWSLVLITSFTVLYMKFAEDRKERRKEGVYGNDWQDQYTTEADPFAKISRAAEDLFSSEAVELGSAERMASLSSNERVERDFCAKTKSLHHRVESLRQESEQRARTRKDVLQLLTTAAEELDALPEELTSRLNKMLRDIDEADNRTAELVTMQSVLRGRSAVGFGGLQSTPSMRRKELMALQPVDAERIPVSLGALRKKLGEVSITTMLRIRNMSDEPLRLKSGVQLKDGKWIQSLNTVDPNNNDVCYHLYPGAEIPPRSEVVVAARNNSNWVPKGYNPTKGIEGEIVYTNKDESWVFRIRFRNQRLKAIPRKCQVSASHVSDDDLGEDQFWNISKDELDIKANNEVAISMDVVRGEKATKAASDHRQSQLMLKSGMLFKNSSFGLGLQWSQKWCILTSTDMLYSDDAESSQRGSKIALKDVTNVRQGSDLVKSNVFEIHTRTDNGRGPYRLSASSTAERDDWIQKLSDAANIFVKTHSDEANITSVGSSDSTPSFMEDGVELVQTDMGAAVYL